MKLHIDYGLCSLSRFELVPGLAPKMVTPDEEARTRSLCCIGDTQKEGGVDNKKNRGVLCLPASPRVAKPFLLRIIDWHLLMPNRAQVESKIRVSVARNLSGKDAAECQIVARTLKIGMCLKLYVNVSACYSRYAGD